MDKTTTVTMMSYILKFHNNHNVYNVYIALKASGRICKLQ